MSNLKKLNELAFETMKKKHPTIREELLPRPKYKDKKANDLTKAVIAWVKLNGFQAERINTTGRPIDKRITYKDSVGYTRQIGTMEWIPSTATKGSADISATIRGRSVKIEVKVGRDRQSDAQVEYQRQVEKAGGIYMIVTCFDDFYNWWNSFVSIVEGEVG